MVFPKKFDEGFVLNQNVLLVNLEVTFWFLKVVHLCDQEIPRTSTNFEFELFQLRADFD